MNDAQQRERMNRHTMQRNEDWYCSPPEDEEEDLSEAPYGRDRWGEPYTYEDAKSAHDDDEWHARRDEGEI